MPDKEGKPVVIYKAVKQNNYGVDECNQVVVGLTLIPYRVEDIDCDMLAYQLENIGSEGVIEFPDGGLVEGKLYQIKMTNISTDFESGIVDDWDVAILETAQDWEPYEPCEPEMTIPFNGDLFND